MAGRTIFLPKMVSTLHCVCRNASTLSWQIWCWEESTGSAFSRPCRYWSNWYLRLNQIFICRISGWVNTTYHYFDSKCFPFFCSKFHGAADHGSKELLRPGLLCSHEPSGGEEHGTIPRGRRSTWMGIGDFNGDIMGYIYIYISIYYYNFRIYLSLILYTHTHLSIAYFEIVNIWPIAKLELGMPWLCSMIGCYKNISVQIKNWMICQRDHPVPSL